MVGVHFADLFVWYFVLSAIWFAVKSKICCFFSLRLLFFGWQEEYVLTNSIGHFDRIVNSNSSIISCLHNFRKIFFCFFFLITIGHSNRQLSQLITLYLSNSPPNNCQRWVSIFLFIMTKMLLNNWLVIRKR